MNIAIINLSSPDTDFDRFGSAGTIIINWLAPHFPEATLTEVYVANGVPLPSTQDYDGYIISGSEKGVYDPTDWMEPVKQLLVTLRHEKIPLFGICFGHQIMAEAFGGSAREADKGFVVGALEYTRGDQKFLAHAMHRDQVFDIPPGATVTASSAYCPVAALDYDFPARSVQFHPEFQKPLVTEAISLFTGNLLTEKEAIASEESVTGTDVDISLYATEVANFFKATLQTANQFDDL